MIKLSKKNSKKHAFTLIELIIVMTLISIIAAIAVPMFGEIRNTANKNVDINNSKTISNLISTLIANNHITPPTSSNAIIIINNIDTDDTADTVGMTTSTGLSIDKTIIRHLQFIPTAQYSEFNSSHFTATITPLGDVIITLSITIDGTTTTAQVYPKPTTSNIYYNK